jgi:hypothetical protein
MARRITIIDGHPDPDEQRFCDALAGAYAEAAEAAGHFVRRVTIAELEFPLLTTRDDWERGLLPAPLEEAPGGNRLGRPPRHNLPALAGLDAGAAKGLPRAGAPTGFRDKDRDEVTEAGPA